MSGYVTKDSGQREAYENGFVRDTQEGKSRPDLISPFVLERLGSLLARGAVKYGERNWEKGQPFSRALASACRHLMQFQIGEDDGEDHLAAVLFNVGCIIHYQEMIRRCGLPAELDDLPKYPSAQKQAVRATELFWEWYQASKEQEVLEEAQNASGRDS